MKRSLPNGARSAKVLAVEPRPIAAGLSTLVLAAILAGFCRTSSFAGLLAAYGAAWVVVSVASSKRWPRPALTPRMRLPVIMLVLAVPLATLVGQWRALLEGESLVGLGTHLEDRLALEALPALHPALVSADQPQTFFVRADGARDVSVRLGPAIASLHAAPLGHGVFRVEYDPRRHGAPRHDGPMEAHLRVDGADHARATHGVVPLAHPRGLRARSDRTEFCATSEETDTLVRVGLDGRSRESQVDDGPSDCAYTPSGLAVGHRHARSVRFVDFASADASISFSSGVHRLAVDPRGARLAVALEEGRVAFVDLSTRRVTHSIDLGGLPDWLVFDGTGDGLVVARRTPAALVRIDVARGTVARVLSLAAPAVTMHATARGTAVVVAVTDWSEAPRSQLGNHFIQDQLLALDAQTFAPLHHVLTGQRSPRQDAAGSTDLGVSPSALDEAEDGAWWVTFAGSDELVRFDPERGTRLAWPLARLGLAAPSGVAALADGSVAVSSASGAQIALLVEGRPRAVVRLAPDDRSLLRDAPDALARRFGERAFHEGTRAGVACQSCHLHGSTDGIAHNIGGRRAEATLDVRGLRGTSPYLRDGSYPRLGDLHEVAENLYRGYLEPAGDRRATLEAWLGSLPLRAAPRRESGAMRRGLDVFVASGCAECHRPPAFTNLGRHPLRSVFPRLEAPPGASLDTPSLRGVGARARWFFDGRASRLEAVVREPEDDRHGRTSALAEQDVHDLVTFLESL